MKKRIFTSIIVLFLLNTFTVFGKSVKIKEKEAQERVQVAMGFFDIAKKKKLQEAAPKEFMEAEALLNEARKELKEENWPYAYEKADLVIDYINLLEYIADSQKAQKELENFRKKK